MKIVVIGAGAAGLLAAGKAAETADEVVIIEKNDIIGKKLLITGKGRCNITNSADIEDMIGPVSYTHLDVYKRQALAGVEKIEVYPK